MHFTLRLLLFFFVVAMALPSCVSKKDFDALQAEKGKMAESLAASQKKVQELDAKITSLEAEMESEKTRLNGEIASLKSDLNATQSELAAAKKAAAEKDAQVAEMKKQIKDAFAIAGDLEVEEINGNVVVKLASPVNYRSGSTRINKDGREAIDQLAETLKNNPNMHVLVEGYTDDEQLIEGAAYKDNWDLSVARAMKVVRRLIKKGVGPEQLAVSGKGENEPVAPNDSDENKAKNRRTEVQAAPNTGTIYKIGGE